MTTINLFLPEKHQYDKVRNSPPPKHTGYSKILGKINVDQKREVENRAMNGDEAAVKMQASWRGYAGRKTLSHLTVPVHDDQANERATLVGFDVEKEKYKVKLERGKCPRQ